MKRLGLLCAVLMVIGRILITPRLNVPTGEGSFEATAHLLCGGMILIGLYDWHSQLGPARFLFWLGWLIAVFELVYVIVQKHAAGLL